MSPSCAADSTVTSTSIRGSFLVPAAPKSLPSFPAPHVPDPVADQGHRQIQQVSDQNTPHLAWPELALLWLSDDLHIEAFAHRVQALVLLALAGEDAHLPTAVAVEDPAA